MFKDINFQHQHKWVINKLNSYITYAKLLNIKIEQQTFLTSQFIHFITNNLYIELEITKKGNIKAEINNYFSKQNQYELITKFESHYKYHKFFKYLDHYIKKL